MKIEIKGWLTYKRSEIAILSFLNIGFWKVVTYTTNHSENYKYTFSVFYFVKLKFSSHKIYFGIIMQKLISENWVTYQKSPIAGFKWHMGCIWSNRKVFRCVPMLDVVWGRKWKQCDRINTMEKMGGKGGERLMWDFFSLSFSKKL